MNQIEDRSVTDALYRASQAGVPIDLVVRGFCCLRPGVPGLSETIRVRSIVGRFLEHSRIFWFSGGREDPLAGEFYIGSADWMYRNLNVRVEAATPVLGRRERERLWEILRICLDDRRQAWEMRPDGRYARPSVGDLPADHPDLVGTHARLMAMALEANRRDAARSRDEG
jgi:polyphosphate kinase